MAEPSRYIPDEEINLYCDMLPVTPTQIMFASGIIDAFVGMRKGKSKFQSEQVTEKGLRPNRKGVVKRKYAPVISLDDISLCVPNAFKFTSAVKINPSEVYVEPEGYVYLPLYDELPVTPNNLYGRPPVGMDITYTYGYETVPEKVKLACAMIAMNISQQGGFANIESATNLDARYALTDPSVFTEDIRRMLVEYRG